MRELRVVWLACLLAALGLAIWARDASARSLPLSITEGRAAIEKYERREFRREHLLDYWVARCWRLSRRTITCRVTEYHVRIGVGAFGEFTWYPNASRRGKHVVVWSSDWIVE